MSSGETKTPRDSLLPVLLVLAGLMGLAVAVVALTGIAGIFVILAISGVMLFAAMHYVLWGWWLSKRLRDADEDADDRAPKD